MQRVGFWERTAGYCADKSVVHCHEASFGAETNAFPYLVFGGNEES